MKRVFIAVVILGMVLNVGGCYSSKSTPLAEMAFDVVEPSDPPVKEREIEDSTEVKDAEDVDNSKPIGGAENGSEEPKDKNQGEVIGKAGFEESLGLEYTNRIMDVPYLSQRDPRWASKIHAGWRMHDNACGVTSIAMVLQYYGIDVLPPDVADWAYSIGLYGSEGTYWGLFDKLPAKYGVKVEALSQNDPQTIVSYLSEGKPLVVSMGTGIFTSGGGHFIVLRGIDENGRVVINDPYDTNLTKMTFPVKTIIDQSATIGEMCFWSITK